MIGQRFFRLVVIEYLGGNKRLCQCDCGNTKVVCGGNIQSGHTRSCGCYNRKIASEQTGGKNNNYIDGRTKKRRLFHESIRLRDVVCQECGKDEEQNRKETINNHAKDGLSLEVHHINDDHEDDRPENCVTLCTKCHNSKGNAASTRRERSIAAEQEIYFEVLEGRYSVCST